MWAASGVIRLRQGQGAAARKAFSKALVEADGLLENTAQNLSALDTKALVLCGLALSEDTRHMSAAVEVYGAAREISSEPGVTADVLRRFDALAEADADGVLTPARAAAAGE